MTAIELPFGVFQKMLANAAQSAADDRLSRRSIALAQVTLRNKGKKAHLEVVTTDSYHLLIQDFEFSAQPAEFGPMYIYPGDLRALLSALRPTTASAADRIYVLLPEDDDTEFIFDFGDSRNRVVVNFTSQADAGFPVYQEMIEETKRREGQYEAFALGQSVLGAMAAVTPPEGANVPWQVKCTAELKPLLMESKVDVSSGVWRAYLLAMPVRVH